MADKDHYALDGLSPARRRVKRDEGVIYDRSSTKNDSAKQPTMVDITSPAGSRGQTTAAVNKKLRTNHAKQRGWDIVAQARQDSKHHPRHKQRQAAQRAAHHHRQRHNIDNYATVHANQLEFSDDIPANFTDDHTGDDSAAAPVSFGLRLRNLLQSRSLKFAGASMMILGVVGGATVFAQLQHSGSAASPQSGQVQSVTNQSASPNNTDQDQAASSDDTSSTNSSDDDDGNLGLWLDRTAQ